MGPNHLNQELQLVDASEPSIGEGIERGGPCVTGP